MEMHEHPFLVGLADSSANTLISSAIFRRYEPGRLIYDEGEESTEFFLILEGRVRFEKRSSGADYRFRIVNELGAGEAFGEMSSILSVPRFLRVTALTPVRVAVISGELIRRFWLSMDPVTTRIGEVLIRHLIETTARYVDDAVSQERLVSLGTMVSAISHDLRTPITLITLNAQLIETLSATADPRLAEVLARHCRNIEAQVQRMMGMLEEVTDFTHGRVTDDYSRLDLRELFETFRFLNATQWESAGVSLEFRGEKTVVDASPCKLLRVLQNLVGNAIEALESREAPAIVISCGLDDEEFAYLTVSDNGPGIPERIRENFWEPFVTAGKARGTGLGTAICRSLVEGHGGRITFDTRTDHGTTFHIRIPVRRPLRGVTTGALSFLRSSGR